MSLTSFRSDPARIKKEMEMSTYSGRYFLNTPGQGNSMPYLEDCHIRLQYYGANIDQEHFLDIENDIRGTSRKLTKDGTQYQYNKHFQPNMSSMYPTQAPLTNESRASDPAWVVRDLDIGYYRWEQPWLNPQAFTEKRFEHNVNTKQQAKMILLSPGLQPSTTRTILMPNVHTLTCMVESCLPGSSEISN